MKAAIDDVAARARALSAMDPTVKISVDAQGLAALRAMRIELAALASAKDAEGLANLAARLKDFGAQADSGRLKTAALALEMQALRGAARDAQSAVGDAAAGGGGGGLAGALAGLAAMAGGGGGGGGGVGAAVGIGALIAAPTGLLGIIPAAAAAAAGVTAFGALAYPTFTTVTGAVSTLATDTQAYRTAVGDMAKDQALAKIKADWAALTPIQAQMVRDFQAIATEWAKLSAAFTPKLMPIITEGFLALSRIMQQLAPFADVAARAISQLLTQFNQFLSSPGFAAFRAEMLKLEGPAIVAIGEGLGKIAVAVGKLLAAMASPDALKIFSFLITVLADAITGLAVVVTVTTRILIAAFHDIAYNFDTLRRDFAVTGHNIAVVFDDLRHWVAVMADTFRANLAGIGRNIAQWASDVGHWVDVAWHWFQQLPGRIAAALASLPGMLFRAGQNAMNGLISGLGSMLGSLGSMAASVASKIAGFFGLSPAVEGPLSGPGAPEIRGRHFGESLASGIAASTGQVHAAVSGLAAAAALGTYGAGGARGGPQLVLQVTPGGSGLDALFMTWLKKSARVYYGGSAQAAFGHTRH